jgi:hypothetical protein
MSLSSSLSWQDAFNNLLEGWKYNLAGKTRPLEGAAASAQADQEKIASLQRRQIIRDLQADPGKAADDLLAFHAKLITLGKEKSSADNAAWTERIGAPDVLSARGTAKEQDTRATLATDGGRTENQLKILDAFGNQALAQQRGPLDIQRMLVDNQSQQRNRELDLVKDERDYERSGGAFVKSLLGNLANAALLYGVSKSLA